MKCRIKVIVKMVGYVLSICENNSSVFTDKINESGISAEDIVLV